MTIRQQQKCQKRKKSQKKKLLDWIVVGAVAVVVEKRREIWVTQTELPILRRCERVSHPDLAFPLPLHPPLLFLLLGQIARSLPLARVAAEPVAAAVRYQIVAYLGLRNKTTNKSERRL